MKKMWIVAAAAMLAACGTPKGYTVQGTLSEAEEGAKVYLFKLGEGVELADSAEVVNGKFSFKGELAEPVEAVVLDVSNPYEAYTMAVELILEPGKITLTETEEGYNVAGTPANDGRNAFAEAERPLVEEFRSAEISDERRAEIIEEYGKLTERMLDANLDNFYGVTLLYDYATSHTCDETYAKMQQFSAAMRATAKMTALEEQLGRRRNSEVGSPFIEVCQPDMEGNMLSLSDVVAEPATRYVLLDFWASWCGPCMREVPHLKEAYAAYHDKGFEIYGVSFDKERDAWVNAVAEKEMTWRHVSSLNRFNNEAAEAYAVEAIPSNFLIDCETGLIVAKDLRGTDVLEKLAELFE